VHLNDPIFATNRRSFSIILCNSRAALKNRSLFLSQDAMTRTNGIILYNMHNLFEMYSFRSAHILRRRTVIYYCILRDEIVFCLSYPNVSDVYIGICISLIVSFFWWKKLRGLVFSKGSIAGYDVPTKISCKTGLDWIMKIFEIARLDFSKLAVVITFLGVL